MDIYLLLAIFIVFVSIIFRKKKWLIFALTFIPLLLFWGTRLDFTPDYYSYLYKFEAQHDMPIYGFLFDAMEGKFEPGFFFLIKIMPSYNAVIFSTTLFLLLCIYIFFNEFVPQYSFPLALFLWLFNNSIFNTFSAMRSSILMGFFLLAVIAKIKSYNKTAIILTLLGSLFHMSGYFLLFLIILPISFYHRWRYIVIPFMFIFSFCALLLPSVFPDILQSFVGVNDNFSDYEDYAKEADYGWGFYIFSLFRISFIMYILSLDRRHLIDEKYIWISWLTIICYLSMMLQIPIMYRFFNYLFLITVVFKCYVLKVDKSAVSKIYVGLSILYAIYCFYGYMHTEYMEFYANYHSFLFK